MNNVAYFEIQASDPEALVKFYSEVFDWKFEKDENLPISYYRITNLYGPLGAILKRPVPTPQMPAGTNAFTCSMQVASFDACASKILELGGQVAMEKFLIPNKCWQGYFLDSDNNVFGIFEAL